MKRILVILFAIVLFASCSRVSGTYVSDGGGLVEQIEFVGKNSCVLTYFGMKLPASYRMNYVNLQGLTYNYRCSKYHF